MPTDRRTVFPQPHPQRRRRAGSTAAGLRRSRRTTVIALLVTLAIVAGAGLWAFVAKPWSSVVVREECTASANGASYTLTADQAHYAAKIGAISLKRELPIRAATIATATAMQESGLKNLDYGDEAGPDSRGLFQQRPSQGWGTEQEIMDPAYAINSFYTALEKVSGYTTLPITQAAQKVQRSALPDAYAKREPEARAFAAAFRGQTHANLTCRLRDASAPGKPKAAQAALSEDLGLTGSMGANSMSVDSVDTQHGWAVAHWAVANANEYGIDSVTFSGQTWTRSSGTWSEAKSADAVGSPTVSVSFHAGS